MTIVGVLFAVSFFACLAVLAHFTSKKVVDEPMAAARLRGSPVADFVDDLLRHRWLVIVGLGVLVALDKLFGLFGGLLQSRIVLAVLVTAIFVGRLVMLRRGAANLVK